ncbi:MAG TPA: MauE/DoxX family redox-associated membrane protein [bacterium]|nr:MauE/DoxX family redox-associated membrane protein [bacterium]HPR89535.1 MauE/DoxX family redox-associated membrane protein [bacterium]
MSDPAGNRLATLLRLGLAVVFIYASLDKIAHPAAFAAAIGHYQLLPGFLAALLAAILPWLELGCGLALLLNRGMAGATLLAAGMNLVFILAITTALARGLDISCGCFSTSDAGSRVGVTRLLEDLVLLLAAGWLYLRAIAAPRPDFA